MQLFKHISNTKFIQGKTVIFLIRDPRDILISLYYSMGGSHVTSQNPDIAKEAEIFKNNMRDLSIDEFVLREMPKVVKRFEILEKISLTCKRYIILRYEDLIYDFEDFTTKFTRYISIPASSIQELHTASRPRTDEDIKAHKRSGKTGQYIEKLKPETVIELNQVLKPVLEKFGYEAEPNLKTV